MVSLLVLSWLTSHDLFLLASLCWPTPLSALLPGRSVVVVGSCLLSIFVVHYHLQWPLCRLLFILFCCCVLIIRYIYISGSWNSTFQGSIQTDSMDPSLQDKKGETLPKLWVCDNQTSSLCQALDSFLYTPRHKSLPRHILLTLLLVASSLAIGMTTNDFGVVLAFNVRYNSFPLSSWASKLNLS